jgi:uncharacterized short protein YbdD (DUF466 family)
MNPDSDNADIRIHLRRLWQSLRTAGALRQIVRFVPEMLEQAWRAAAFCFQRADQVKWRKTSPRFDGTLGRLMRMRSRRLRPQLNALREPMPALETTRAAFLRISGAIWQWLRGAAGDQAYENYLRHAEKVSGQTLTAKEFYRDQLQRKYSRPNRCC